MGKAHHKIANEVVKRKKLKQLFVELKEFEDQISALRASLDKVVF